jgi:hypothetical protein
MSAPRPLPSIADADYEGHLGEFEDLGLATDDAFVEIAQVMSALEETAQGAVWGIRDLINKRPKKGAALRDLTSGWPR